MSTPRTASSLADESRSKSDEAVDFNNGIADKKMSTAMIIEATGSNPFHPSNFVRIVETTTPTDPKVSARMWRKIPRMLSLSSEQS